MKNASEWYFELFQLWPFLRFWFAVIHATYNFFMTSQTSQQIGVVLGKKPWVFCKLPSCQQSCPCSWTKWAWTIWLCLEIFLPCKCSNCIQVKPIVSNYAPQPKNHWRFSPIGIVQPEVSWISSFLKCRCLNSTHRILRWFSEVLFGKF